MSQLRYRVAALTLGGLLLGAPLLTNGTASAEQIEAGGRSVVFDGTGMLGLSCRSAPDVNTMTVPAESTVRVINRTGHPARLKLGTAEKGVVPANGSAELVFRRGTTSVQLTPTCALGAESTPLMVTATPSPTGSPPEDNNQLPPTPEQPTGGAVGSPPVTSPNTPAGTPSNPGTTLPGTPSATPPRTTTATTTTTTRPAVTRPTGERTVTPAAAAVVTTMPQGGAATTKVKTKVLRGTDVSTPTFAGMPPGESQAIVPGVPTVDLPTMSEAAALTPGAPTEVAAAAEPVAAMRPMPENRPIGLLAVVAGVCVLGVGIAAIRSFVSQRASRATIA